MLISSRRHEEDVGAHPVTEERHPEPVSAYAKGKLASEAVVLFGLGPRATIFRPSYILGRAFLTMSLWGRTPYLVSCLQQGKAIPAIDGGRNLMTPVDAVDAAEWVVRSFDNAAADGQIINLVGREIITQERYYESVARALGVKLQLFPCRHGFFALILPRRRNTAGIVHTGRPRPSRRCGLGRKTTTERTLRVEPKSRRSSTASS